MRDRFIEAASRVSGERGAAVCGRYAPSPTGDLHLGNLRTALVAWLQARLSGGLFIMRMEDLDRPRSRAGCAEKQLEDLRRLGIDWDEGPDLGGPFGPYHQSERDAVYEAALEHLSEHGRLFRCFCSRRDIREAASAPHGGTVVYPGTCRVPPQAGAANAGSDAAGPSAWRFALNDESVRFHDCLQGMQYQDVGSAVGDFVVRRRDRLFAYQLAVVVDDALMGVTDVVRGDDLIDSAPRQIVLQAALEVPTPRYWHVPVMRDEDGRRMSKRYGALSLDQYCAAGGSPERLVALLAAQLRLADPGEPLSARELLSGLEFSDLLGICRPGTPRSGTV